jgi:hypothetical protein
MYRVMPPRWGNSSHTDDEGVGEKDDSTGHGRSQNPAVDSSRRESRATMTAALDLLLLIILFALLNSPPNEYELCVMWGI